MEKKANIGQLKIRGAKKIMKTLDQRLTLDQQLVGRKYWPLDQTTEIGGKGLVDSI